jgi:hypothetical protein
LNALEADLFWTPEAYGRVLTVLVSPNPRRFESSRFALCDVACEKTLLIKADGSQHLLLRSRHRFLQLLCLGDAPVSQPCAIALLADEVPDVETKVRLMRRFAALTRHRVDAERAPRWSPQQLALRNGLIALDGRLHGASLRETAEIIFGAERVARDWAGGQGWMKSRVARALRRGRQLAGGGYRALLR